MPTRGIEFSTLSLVDALDLAILIEEEATERYMEFADQMEMHRTPESAAFFRFMSQNEARHGAALSARRRQLFQDAPRNVTRAMLFDVEAPDYDEARAFMSARQALQSALRSEIKAHEFFVAALPRVRDPEVHALFEELREEEIEHQSLIRQQLARLPPDHGLSADDFVDEPTSQ